MINFFIGYFIGNLISLLLVYQGFSLNKDKENSSEDIDNF